MVSVVATAIISIAIRSRGNTAGSEIGVCLNLILMMNVVLIRFVECWTTVEVLLSSIARHKQMQSEVLRDSKPWQIDMPDCMWPSAGDIRIENVTAGYR
jgi:hypothetical protein